MLFRCKFKQLAFVFSLCTHWEMGNLSRITMESFGAFFLLLFKTSIIFSFPASHQMLAYLTRLLQGSVQKLEQDFNILKQSIMSLISYWRTKEIRWSKPQRSRGCVTDLAPPLSSPVSPSPQAWSTDPASPRVRYLDCGNAMQWLLLPYCLRTSPWNMPWHYWEPWQARCKASRCLKCWFSPPLPFHVQLETGFCPVVVPHRRIIWG